LFHFQIFLQLQVRYLCAIFHICTIYFSYKIHHFQILLDHHFYEVYYINNIVLYIFRCKNTGKQSKNATLFTRPLNPMQLQGDVFKL
jgi:hypothetical protein